MKRIADGAPRNAEMVTSLTGKEDFHVDTIAPGTPTDQNIECDYKREALVHELAVAYTSLFDATFEIGRYTAEGYHQITSHALVRLEKALSVLGIDDLSKEPRGEVLVGIDCPNWSGREYNHLRTEGWQSP